MGNPMICFQRARRSRYRKFRRVQNTAVGVRPDWNSPLSLLTRCGRCERHHRKWLSRETARGLRMSLEAAQAIPALAYLLIHHRLRNSVVSSRPDEMDDQIAPVNVYWGLQRSRRGRDADVPAPVVALADSWALWGVRPVLPAKHSSEPPKPAVAFRGKRSNWIAYLHPRFAWRHPVI